MLVALYTLDKHSFVQPPISAVIRRGLAPERRIVVEWVSQHFGQGWASECEAAFSATPTTCVIAIAANELLGFAAWNVTALGFFGPTGVAEAARGSGIGTALLLGALREMRAAGYGYAIIGAAGAEAFFAKVAGAVPILGSTPGIYGGMLRPPRS